MLRCRFSLDLTNNKESTLVPTCTMPKTAALPFLVLPLFLVSLERLLCNKLLLFPHPATGKAPRVGRYPVFWHGREAWQTTVVIQNVVRCKIVETQAW